MRAEQLQYLQGVQRWLFFEMKIGDTVAVSKMAKAENADKFRAAIECLMDDPLTRASGFLPLWTDATRSDLTKRLYDGWNALNEPHVHTSKPMEMYVTEPVKTYIEAWKK